MDFIEEFDFSLNLWIEEGVRTSIEKFTPEKLHEFVETLYYITKHHVTPPIATNENFSFVANSSLSGGFSPCAHLDCRLDKLDSLVSFASLYADTVYISNPFEFLYYSWEQLSLSCRKHEIAVAIYQYTYLKPYLALGIIKYSCGYVRLCEHHHNTLAKPLYEKIRHKETELTNIFNQHFLSNCTMTFDRFDNGEPFIEIKDNSSIIDHGITYIHFDKKSNPKLLNKISLNDTPYILSKSEIEQEDILSVIVTPIINDLVEQEWVSFFYHSSLLIDNKIKHKVSSIINIDTVSVNAKIFTNSVNHYLPTIQSRDPLEIIKLREMEGDAFKVYRDKLQKIIIDAPKNHNDNFPEKFRDIVLPEIHLINKKINDFRVKKKTDLRDKLIFGAGAMTFGLYSGILPSNLSNVLAAIGGGTALVSSMIDYKSAFLSKDEARANDYYFLWELTRK